MSKKKSFVKGTFIFVAASLVTRMLGLFQRVPLDYMLDSVGRSFFVASQSVYLMFLAVATAGVPSTLSKMVSEYDALNKVREAERLYYATLIFGILSGFICASFIFIFAPLYASMIKIPDAALAIRALAPALLLFPVLAMMRGYMQGKNRMQASAVSQITEQIVRVLFAICLALLFLKNGASQKWIAAGASFGGVFGSIGAFIIMVYYIRKFRQLDRKIGTHSRRTGVRKVPLNNVFRSIFKLSVPTVIASLAVPATNFIDVSITTQLLSLQVDLLSAQQLSSILTYRSQSIAGIPPILATALCMSIIPIISEAFAKQDISHLKQQISLGMRISLLSGMPIVIALTVGAYSVNGFLFSTPDGSGIVAMATFGTIFQITMMITSSILLGLGKPYIPMISVTIGIIIKLGASFCLFPFFNIYGIIGGTAVSFLIITWLNLRVMKKIVPFEVFGTRWPGFLLTVALTSGFGLFVERLGEQLVTIMSVKLAYLITISLVTLLTTVLFVIGFAVFGVVQRDELHSYPRGVQKVLRPLMRAHRSSTR
ncbi:putative polysaccharide biosynthesis protein [Paenibacillus popilliae]|uniref:Membrane protein n=1 Tax=Paenibacillus popilliae ATCC 14706 TaxID=1212764 RepID=M9LBI8_PAEPP|nr:polysaccharide biosynthesis protein [Paenibacillus popilliae]GAC43202.1 membrane protein [Paenibacillus popilliae ATCC 14706]